MPQRIKTETAVVACHDAVYNGRNAAAAASSGATKKKKRTSAASLQAVYTLL